VNSEDGDSQTQAQDSEAWSFAAAPIEYRSECVRTHKGFAEGVINRNSSLLGRAAFRERTRQQSTYQTAADL
jgi:hypothetical protein